jgi:tRNA pseudouridine synthase 10
MRQEPSTALPDSGQLLEKIVLAAAEHEFRSFVLGFGRPAAYDREAHEKACRRLKIELGTRLLERWPGRRIDFEDPELRIDVQRDSVQIRAAPLYIGGRYRKLSRAIPSSRWIHHACRGRGCEACGQSGNLCGPSVQEIFAAPVLRETGGRATSFHALGREDTDARMLGSGRPFVLEVHDPRRRSLDLRRVALEVEEGGLAELLAPILTGRSAVRAAKEAAAEKTYRAWVRVEGVLPRDARERVESLAGRVVTQYSPRRVMHRRGADCLRRKRLAESTWLGELAGELLWEVRAESGTYIKELVSGDGGRTSPSLAEVLAVRANCAALDVLEIHWSPPWE